MVLATLTSWGFPDKTIKNWCKGKDLPCKKAWSATLYLAAVTYETKSFRAWAKLSHERTLYPLIKPKFSSGRPKASITGNSTVHSPILTNLLQARANTMGLPHDASFHTNLITESQLLPCAYCVFMNPNTDPILIPKRSVHHSIASCAAHNSPRTVLLKLTYNSSSNLGSQLRRVEQTDVGITACMLKYIANSPASSGEGEAFNNLLMHILKSYNVEPRYTRYAH
jgi:hypothetical protein